MIVLGILTLCVLAVVVAVVVAVAVVVGGGVGQLAVGSACYDVGIGIVSSHTSGTCGWYH